MGKIIKRNCGFKGCKTLTNVEIISQNLEDQGFYHVKWCEYHSKLYNEEIKILNKMLDKYNKKKIKNKFGKIIKFTHHSDLNNYLFKYDKKTSKEITRKAEKNIK